MNYRRGPIAGGNASMRGRHVGAAIVPLNCQGMRYYDNRNASVQTNNYVRLGSSNLTTDVEKILPEGYYMLTEANDTKTGQPIVFTNVGTVLLPKECTLDRATLYRAFWGKVCIVGSTFSTVVYENGVPKNGNDPVAVTSGVQTIVNTGPKTIPARCWVVARIPRHLVNALVDKTFSNPTTNSNMQQSNPYNALELLPLHPTLSDAADFDEVFEMRAVLQNAQVIESLVFAFKMLTGSPLVLDDKEEKVVRQMVKTAISNIDKPASKKRVMTSDDKPSKRRKDDEDEDDAGEDDDAKPPDAGNVLTSGEVMKGLLPLALAITTQLSAQTVAFSLSEGKSGQTFDVMNLLSTKSPLQSMVFL